MLKIKKISEVLGKSIYTDDGDFFGEIDEANIIENKINGWKIRVTGNVSNILGGVRGVITGKRKIYSALEIFFMGATASLIAFLIGSFLGNLI